MPSETEITVAELLPLIGTPECPAIVDVCIDADFQADPHLIPGSFRHPHTDMPGLTDRLGGRGCVVVCQKGGKLSQGVAAWLRSEGLAAKHLAGGMYGWRDTAGALRIPAAAVPAPVGGATLWVTAEDPGIDATACAWLIRRFVDPAARLLFVEAVEVASVAERFGAMPIGAGGRASFDALRQALALRSPALDRLDEVVRDAGTEAPDPVQQAAGLAAIFQGLATRTGARRDAGFGVLDALYAWARGGQDA
ncbi:MAG: chromate resistance protein [Rhodobacter sp.]|nr:chromate resistance protein [Rhodobacter sp.]